MTVSEIVNHLLEYKMITTEAASVLLQAEIKAIMFDKQDRSVNTVFQPYHGVPNGATSNPYYYSTSTNDAILVTTTNDPLKVK